MLVFCAFETFRSERDLCGVFVFYRFKKLTVLKVISGCARFLWSLGVLVFYRFKAFRSERDLWGCSLSIVLMLSVLSGISGGARFIEL